MFTGIITHQGVVSDVRDGAGVRTLELDVGNLTGNMEVGGSIAVNGVCLTVVSMEGPLLTTEVMGETLRRSTLGTLAPGGKVNLERPVRADGLFEGHIVQGHVDGVATVLEVSADGGSRRVRFEADAGLLRYVVEKGSIALDGVSLTVTAVADGEFEVALIPHTLAATTLGEQAPGDVVNVEIDVIAKYVERLNHA